VIDDKDIPALARKLIPHLAKRSWQTGTVNQANAGAGGGSVPQHALYGAAHTGTLDRSQAPWVASDIATAINIHNTLGDPHSQYVHVSVAKTISASHNFAHATIGFTSPDQDSYWLQGRAFVGYAGSADVAAFGHRDYRDIADCAISQNANGDTTLNGYDVLSLSALGETQLRIGLSLVELDDANAATIRTEHYTSQTTGWALTYDGALDVRYLYADEMHVKAFIADLEQALAGGQIISKSVAKLSDTFTVPNYSASAQLNVESFPGWPNAHVFVNGDTIGIKIISRTDGTPTTAGSLVIGWVFGTVVFSSFNLETKTQTWTFTRLSSTLINGFAAGGTASAGTIVEAGAIVLDFGVSGNGYYEVNAIDGQMAVNSPYWQIVTWGTHPIYDRTVRNRGGNLAGVGFSGQYGLYARGIDANQYIVASGSGITVRNTSISQYDGSNNLTGQWTTSGLSFIGQDVAASKIRWTVSSVDTYDIGAFTGGDSYNRMDLRSWGSGKSATRIGAWNSGQVNSPVAYVEVRQDNYAAEVHIIADEVGIGTASPGAKLHVDAGGNGGIIIEHDDASSGYGRVAFRDAANVKWEMGILADSYSTAALQNAWYLFQHRNKTDTATNLYAIVVNNDGDVGFGTQIPGDNLHIDTGAAGGITVEYDDGSAGYGRLAYKDSTSGNLKWEFGVLADSYTTTALQNAWYLFQYRNKSETATNLYALLVNDDGQLWVGNTTDIGFGSKIQTNGAAWAQGAITTEAFVQLKATTTPATASGYARIFLRSSDNKVCILKDDGTVTALN
jgi:hypothetical protein